MSKDEGFSSTPDGSSPNVVFLGSDPEHDRSIQSALRTQGLSVTIERDPGSAIQRLRELNIDCIVLSDDIDRSTGIDILERARERVPDLPVVFLEGDGLEQEDDRFDEYEFTEAVQGGVTSVSYGRLADRIRAVVARYSVERAQRSEHEIVDRLEDQIQQTKQKITALHRVAMSLGRSRSESEIYDSTVEAGEAILNLDICFAFKATEEQFVPMAQSSTPTDRDLTPVPLDAGVMGETHRTGESSRTVDMDLHPIAEPEFGEYRSGISVPIGDHGVFQAVAKQPGAFDQIELELAELLTSHAASALRRLGFEEQLRIERDHYAVLFNNTADCLVETEFVDGDPIIRAVNPAFGEVFGYAEEDVVGRSVDDVIVPDEYQEEAQRINEQVLQGASLREEVHRETTEGMKHFLLRFVEVDSDTAYAVYTDITDRKRAERELARKNERLKRFSQIVSHDIRNPLNVASGNLDLARQECSSDHLEEVSAALDRIEDIAEQTLALARQGEVISDPGPVDLADIVQECWTTVDTGEAEIHVGSLPTITADPNRLTHVIENLYRNAVEYGGQQVDIRVGSLDDGFFVEDNGTGIDIEETDSLFEAGYSTADDSPGFGLAIVKEVVDAHGWSIDVTEGSDGGARFEITGVDVVG